MAAFDERLVHLVRDRVGPGEHDCDGRPPDRKAPGNDVSASVTYGACVANEDENYLVSVRDTADRIKLLKADDGQILVAGHTELRGAPEVELSEYELRITPPDRQSALEIARRPNVDTDVADPYPPPD